MSKLTESEYEEYIRLLKSWMDVERALERTEDEVDPEARERVRAAHAAVRGFRQQHELDSEAVREPQPIAEGSKHP